MNVMVDLETLSTKSNAVILTIGAIKFNEKDNIGEGEKDTFYMRVNIESCRRLGLDINPETEKWWEYQPLDVRGEAFNPEDRYDIKTVLEKFSEWFKGSKYIWSQGANFDIPILSEVYSRLNMSPPWKYCDVRDTRTTYMMGNFNPMSVPQNSKHHALEDCRRQIYGVKKSFRNISNSYIK